MFELFDWHKDCKALFILIKFKFKNFFIELWSMQIVGLAQKLVRNFDNLSIFFYLMSYQMFKE